MELGIILISGIVMKICLICAFPTQLHSLRICNADLSGPRIPTHIWGWGLHHPRSLNASLFTLLYELIPARLHKSSPLSCIFACACMYALLSRLSLKPIAPRWILATLPTSQHRSALKLFPTFFIEAQRNDSAAVSAGRSALTCVRERVPACAEAPDPPTSQPMCQLSAHAKTICRKSKLVSACHAGVKFHFECSSDTQLAWTHVLFFSDMFCTVK